MSATTGIEWTEATWNPWMGCTKVSPGCAHCYMFRGQRQYGRDPEIVVRSKTKFTEPLKWTEPRTIFTCSWSDWFHEAADQWRGEAWDVVRATPQHTYQILTKRQERIAAHLPYDWGDGWPNVWLGVSVENQRWIGRAARLALTPAAVRFLSCEPLLGPLDLTVPIFAALDRRDRYPFPNLELEYRTQIIERMDWVIVGGESGPGYRPMGADWALVLRDQCAVAGVPYFLKQLGGWPDKRGGEKAVLDGERHTAMPERVSA